MSFRNCKIFTITDNKVWLWSDSLTPLRAGFTQIKAESVNFCNTEREREREKGERTEEVLIIGDKSGDGWTWWRQEERLGGRVVSS